jgi:hypothetical protein
MVESQALQGTRLELQKGRDGDLAAKAERKSLVHRRERERRRDGEDE